MSANVQGNELSRAPAVTVGHTTTASQETQLLPLVARAASCILNAAVAEVSLFGNEQERIVVTSTHGEAVGQHALLADALIERAGSPDRCCIPHPLAIEDVRSEVPSETADALASANIISLLGVPITDRAGESFGVLSIGEHEPREWKPAEIETLRGLAQLASAAASQPDGELDHALARLRRSFDDGLSGHAVAAADGRILACNPEFARIAGFNSVADAMKANLRSLEAEPGSFLASLERLKEAPLIPLEEFNFVRRDGEPAQVLARLAATLDSAGEVVEVRVYLVDITERFRIEQQLREAADRMRLVELATQDVFWDWQLATGRLSWNGSIARRFRYQEHEVRNSIDWHVERIHADDRERVVRGVERAVLGVDTSWSDEYRFLRGDGTYASVLDRAHIVRNGRGEPVRVVGWILDISELKASEEAQRFLARASAALDVGLEVDAAATTLARLGVPGLADFCLVDLLEPDGSLRRRAVAHADARLEQFLGLGLTFPIGSERGAAPIAAVQSGAPQFLAYDGSGDGIGVGESARMRAYVIVPIAARDRVLGAATFGFTETRRQFDPLDLMTAKEVARRAGLAMDNAVLYETARQAVKVRNEVLGVVSHDLRSPVNTMMATVSLLAEHVSDDRENVRHWFDILLRTITQMKALIEDLLDASRIESQQFALDLAAGNAVAIINEATEMLRPAADEKGIAIETRAADNLPPVIVDAAKMVRVIGNLIENAIKFSPRGGSVQIRAELNSEEVAVSVSDQGAGIPRDQQHRVFDRFWTERRANRRGSGLGLTIAKGIVEAHGGRIWVQSQEDKGSTFTFTLPTQVGRFRRPAAGNRGGNNVNSIVVERRAAVDV
jgi:PAS domain S-box-containing protein